MRDCLGVGFADEFASLFGQPLAQFAKILYDAVMNDRNEIGGVRMGIVFGRPAMRCPAGMTNTDIAPKRFAIEPSFERAQLAFRATPAEHAVVERGNAGRIIASVLKALEGVDQLLCNRFLSQGFRLSRTPPRWPLSPFPFLLGAMGGLRKIKPLLGVCLRFFWFFSRPIFSQGLCPAASVLPSLP